MGSVGYRCLLCGRIGNGGWIVMDGIDFPICIGKFNEEHTGPANWSCLRNDVLSDAWVDTSNRHVLALRGVLLCRPSRLDNSWLQRLAENEVLIRRVMQFAVQTAHWNEKW